MKRFVMAALLAVFACAPSVAWAGTTAGPAAPIGDANAAAEQVAPAPVGVFPGEAAGYAAREAAAPALAQFAGGGRGIYIGSGAVVVLLLVIIIVLLIKPRSAPRPPDTASPWGRQNPDGEVVVGIARAQPFILIEREAPPGTRRGASART